MKIALTVIIACTLGLLTGSLLQNEGSNDVAVAADLKSFFGVVVSHNPDRKEIDVRIQEESGVAPLWDTIRFSYDKNSVFFSYVIPENIPNVPTVIDYTIVNPNALSIGSIVSVTRNMKHPTKTIIDNIGLTVVN